MLLIVLSIFCINLVIGRPLYGNHDRAANGEFPFVVSIGLINRNNNGNNHICGGSLISKKHILTSEYCVRNKNVNNLQVLIGTNDLRSGIKYNVTSSTFYDSWAKVHHVISHMYNDVAILTLSKKVSLVNPKIFGKRANSRFYEQIVTTAGWGATDSNNKISQYLQKSELKVLSQEECSKFLYERTKIQYRFHERYMCTTSTSRTLIAKGDDGSPLLYNNTIIAVNDGTFPLDRRFEKVNVHLAVSYYQKFIQDTMQQ